MIITDQKYKEQIRDWVSNELGIPKIGEDNFASIGFLKDRELVGGVVFHDNAGFMMEMSGASVAPDFLDRGAIRYLADYVFNKCSAIRLNARVAKKNRKARAFVERLGFKEEGCARKAFDGSQDAIFYGMLKHECRWLS